MTHRTIRFYLLILACAILALGVSALPATARAENGVSYVEYSWDGSKPVPETKNMPAEEVPSDGNISPAGTF